MDYSSDYRGTVVGCSPRGRRQFQKKWFFDTEELKSGSIALNVEATYIPRSERSRSLAIADADCFTDYDALDSASEEIERKSARIQRDIQRERRARSVSPRRGVTPVTSYTPTTALPPRSARGAPTTPRQVQTQAMVKPHVEFPSDPLAADNLGFHIENADKMILGQELKTLRGALFTTKVQIRDAEKDAKLLREKAEEARSELMLVDFKRATAGKDLQRLVDDIERKRAMSQTYDTEIEAKQRELRGFQSFGISPEEAKTLHEENVDLRQRQRSLDVAQLESGELCRQLATAKEDLLREQKQGRIQRDELVEELERCKGRLDECQKGWAVAQREVHALEAAFRRMERDKDDLIQEQSKEYKAFKRMARQESQENRHKLSQEVELLNKELMTLQVRVNDLQADLKAKDEHNLTLRQQLTTLTSEIAEEQAARAAETEEHRQTLQKLRKETDSAMLKLKESLFLEKQRALEELRAEIDQERKDNSSRSDERVAQMLAENAQLLSEKNNEIARLQEKMKDMQESQRAAERRMQDKMDLQVREAVARERAAMEKETQWKLQSERENLARDTKQRVNEMQVTLEHERETSQRLNREIAQLKEELEEQRRLSREAAKEKLVAVARAKDQIREQSNAELENMRQKVKQEMQLEVDRLQNQLRDTEDEMRTLKAENQRLLGRERDNLSSLDHTEKTIINEINEENRRSASVLGVSPRQVQFSAVADSATSRAQINAALVNLRAVNEELRKHIQELTSELDSCRAMITTMEKEKEESLENIRLEMEKKRTLELEKIKEKLIRLEVDALDLSRTEAQFPLYRPSPNNSFRLDLSTSRDSCEDISNDHTEELAKMAQANARQSLTNSMVGALRRKDQEIAQLRDTLATLRAEAAQDKHASSRLNKNDMEQEFEKSQALLHRSNTEQKRINQAQQREIARLEKEIHTLALMFNNKNLNKSPSSPNPSQHQHHQHHQHQQQQQQQYLQERIKQLHSENDALRRKHLLSKNNLSVPDLPATWASLPTSSSVMPGTLLPAEKRALLEEKPGPSGYCEKESAGETGVASEKRTPASHKLAEMTKLENTLSDQNQELLRLEQAYSQLHNHYTTSPSLALAHILHTAR